MSETFGVTHVESLNGMVLLSAKNGIYIVFFVHLRSLPTLL